ncbi:MAG: sigma 54-interacting transcriptional regulator [Polyangiaceae bacterium]
MGDHLDDHTTVLASKFAPSATSSPTFTITVIEGPDTGGKLTLDASRYSAALIGSSSVCDLRLTDRQASRRHITLDVTDTKLQLTDLGSTNGTVVNDVIVTRALLRGGEIIRIGQNRIRVDLDSAAKIVEISGASGFGRVIGASREMRRLYPLCRTLADAKVAVVVEGETGTGKELVAESLHEESPRAAGPFVVFDCTGVPPNLVESELFGHERGAFTGATTTRKGVFEQAHGGTLLIDEIGDLDFALQPKLLRAIERSEIRRVGGDRTFAVDVRILSATRRDLDHEVQAGRFRDDLYHRLAVVRLGLPPLRARRGDVRLLARTFAEKLGDGRAIPEALLVKWEDYAWPGNVRELRNAVVRYLALGDVSPEEYALDETPLRSPREGVTGEGELEGVVQKGLPYSAARKQALEAFERQYIERVLAEHGGNVLRAAAASGIARRHLQRVKARHQK